MSETKILANGSTKPKVRACDNCYSVKQNCSGGSPCDRCQRRGMPCTMQRPIKRMGRPRASENKISKSKTTILHSANMPKHDVSELFSSSNVLRIVETAGNMSSHPISDLRSHIDPIQNRDALIQKSIEAKNESLLSGIVPGSNLLSIDSPSLVETPNEFYLKYVLPSNGSCKSDETDEPIESRDSIGNLIDLVEMSENTFKEKHYLRYFIEKVAPVLFSSEDSITFLNYILPMSLASKLVKYPLIGIAAIHYSGDYDPLHSVNSTLMNPESSLSYSSFRDFSVYRTRAKSLLFEVNIDQNYMQDEVLASFILNSIMEILIGTSLEWSGLLREANKIIEARGGMMNIFKKKETKSFEFMLIQLFCYLDLVSSLSSCNPPFLEKIDNGMGLNSPFFNDGSYSLHDSIFNDDNFLLEDDKMDFENLIWTGYISSELFEQSDTIDVFNIDYGFRFGVAGDIFKILGNISTLSSLRPYREKSPKYEQAFQKIANIIELKLQNWSVPENIDFEDVTDIQKTQFALAVQWAAFLRLHQIKFGYNRDDDRPKICLRTILEAIDAIPDGSSLESALMFPLVLAGSVATSEKDRDLIVRKIRNIKETLKFPYIGEFERLLWNIWGRDTVEGQYVNWAAIRYYCFPGLVMF